ALDNLSHGHRSAVAPGVPLVEADLGEGSALEGLFRRERFDAVMHLAAESIVSESVADPGKHFEANVLCGLNLLGVMRRHGVKRLVFSSTAAVYGEAKGVPIVEGHLPEPVNPYGESKLMFERILGWYHRAYGLQSVSLRYFNAAGASERFGEDHHPETHLIPLAFQVALGQQPWLPLYGTDYPTADGTCVRDYIHVADIARAHLLALKRLEGEGCAIYNLGNGAGYSVREVAAAVEEVTSKRVPLKNSPRRAGDPPALVASSERARQELGWQPRYPGLAQIVGSAWEWQRQHPRGYETA
ncbi:MAG: UDP-glucose 4-epimerase GalE, partial [Chloroflexota bacterium]|nr:UDP-glucose 4-epimerase GalE [Chloroflexota bacterium]